MAMTVQIVQLTGAGPTFTRVDNLTPGFLFNREDTRVGTTAIPKPTATGTNFSWVKTFQIEVTVHDSKTMTNVRVGKVTNEADTGTKIWQNVANASYTQAASPPGATGDNNVTGPTINGDASTAMELITVPPAPYAAGPYTTNAKHGNMVELALGVDVTNTQPGTNRTMPSLRWTWSEA